MRLDRLWIGKFKNLENFEIDFDEQHNVSVLIGRNGSAKSNLIEALIRIFRALDLKQDPEFSYEVEYVIAKSRVTVKGEIDPKPQITVESRMLDSEQLSTKVKGKECFALLHSSVHPLLPRYVFGYYSGISQRMNSLFYSHEKKYSDSAMKGKDERLRSLILAKPIHSQLVLLAFYLRKDLEIERFLRETLSIEGFDSALFKLVKPDWAKSGATPLDFWGARGTVNDLFVRIRALSLGPITIKERVQKTYRKHSTEEHMYLYLPSVEKLRELAEMYSDAKDFFRALETMHLGDLLSEVRIRVKVKGIDGSITFRELSEGEQQLLTVLGLMRFTSDAEALYFLDEPDTHLNPAWGLRYLEFLRQIGDIDTKSHTILATHDPVFVAGLKKEEVRILSRDEHGRIESSMPDEDPKGRGIAAVLTSELYGFESQLDLETQRLLDKKRDLASKDELTAEELLALSSLNAQLKSLDSMNIVPDPIYNEFALAFHNRAKDQDLNKSVLTKAEIEERHALAKRILEELK